MIRRFRALGEERERAATESSELSSTAKKQLAPGCWRGSLLHLLSPCWTVRRGRPTQPSLRPAACKNKLHCSTQTHNKLLTVKCYNFCCSSPRTILEKWECWVGPRIPSGIYQSLNSIQKWNKIKLKATGQQFSVCATLTVSLCVALSNAET